MENTAGDIVNETDMKIVSVAFRDRKHFYSVVSWLNANIGRGKTNWTIHGRPLKAIKKNEHSSSNKPVSFNVSIRNTEAFNEEDVLYLNMGL